MDTRTAQLNSLSDTRDTGPQKVSSKKWKTEREPNENFHDENQNYNRNIPKKKKKQNLTG